MFRLYVTIGGHERLWIESRFVSTCTHEIVSLANSMDLEPLTAPTEYRLVFEE